MVETSRPWTGISVGDSGPFSSEQWADIWKTIGIGGAKADSGPLIGSGTSPDIGLTVQANSPAAANVVVTPGSALVEGTWYQNTTNNTLTIAANGSGNPRIDTVVLRKDYSAQTVRLAVKQGTPAVTPSPPGLTQTDGVLWEIPLGDVAVANGFVSIAAADITPRRHFANAADGVYELDVLNNSGGTLVTGDVVVWDATADRAVTTTTTFGNKDVAGVWVGRTANGAYGRVLVQGIGYVRVTGAATRGNLLHVSATAAHAQAFSDTDANSHLHLVGHALETTSGTGLCLARVNVYGSGRGASASYKRTSGNYTSNNAAMTDIDATNLNLTIVITGNTVQVTFQGQTANSTNANYAIFDLLVDGVAYSGGTAGLMQAGLVAQSIGGTPYPIQFTLFIGGLSAGSHTFKVQWAVVGGNTQTLYGDGTTSVVNFGVVEAG